MALNGRNRQVHYVVAKADVTGIDQQLWPGSSPARHSRSTPSRPGGTEPWKSNGTAASTRRAQGINPGHASSYPSELVDLGTRLFFSADDGSSGRELWKRAP